MSDINDTLRELLQKITGLKDRQDRQESHYHSYHELFVNDGWIPDTKTWTRASDTTMTLVGDYTTQFPSGTRLKVTDSTVKYYSVISATYGAPNTTVTFTGGIDYVLAGTPTAGTLYYSYAECPVGFPDKFNWTPTYTGFSAAPTNTVSKFWITGKTCFFEHSEATNGTSNADTFHITLPVTAATITNMTWAGVCGYAVNDSSALTGAAKWSVASGSTYTNLNIDMAAGVWATSNGKRARMIGWYAIAA